MLRLEDEEQRFHRQGLISWWDQEALTKARVLVVGAGALGNEVVKNLVLVGVGQIEVCDMDSISNSNLSRCIFFRETDLGKPKAAVLATRAMELYSGVNVVSHVLPIQRLGIGHVSEFDLVIGALDNREARAWVNQACRKLSLYWIDGAIEGLRGLARMFAPGGPCYSCTLSENDYKQMSHRKSCALLAPEDLLEGKTPTNASTASVIAAIQVQEAIKYLVGKHESLSLVGKAWMFTGDYMDSFISKYQEDEFCLAHDTYVDLKYSKSMSPIELLIESGLAEQDCVLDFEDELVTLQPCSRCGEGEELTYMRSALPPGRGRCHCGADLPGGFSTSISKESALMNKQFVELGLAQKDVVTVRTSSDRRHYVVIGKK